MPEFNRAEFRAYFELMEAMHPGPYRQFDADVRAMLDTNAHLIGQDEHQCEVCGVRNVNPDGTDRRFFWGHGGRYFCQDHQAQFEATFV